MKRKLGFIFFILFFAITLLNINVYAADLDVIESFIINATPREDATIDFNYQIKWKVLDSTTAGPLTWVKIGIPNEHADSVKAITDNIKSIKRTGEYVRIDFDDEYKAGEIITFAFSFHQPYLCQEKKGNYIYKYIPAWFDDCKVKKLVVSWDGDGVIKSNNNRTNGNDLVWEKENLAKGQKVSVEVQYDGTYFTNVDTDVPKGTSSGSGIDSTTVIIVGFIVLVVIASSRSSSRSYYTHRGYYGTTYAPRYDYSTRYRSRRESSWERSRITWNDDDDSWSSFGGGSSDSGGGCACACACAGSGRAGCSKKDFYGTKLKSKLIIEELEK